jgi:hypothetical protein
MTQLLIGYLRHVVLLIKVANNLPFNMLYFDTN